MIISARIWNSILEILMIIWPLYVVMARSHDRQCLSLNSRNDEGNQVVPTIAIQVSTLYWYNH